MATGNILIMKKIISCSLKRVTQIHILTAIHTQSTKINPKWHNLWAATKAIPIPHSCIVSNQQVTRSAYPTKPILIHSKIAGQNLRWVQQIQGTTEYLAAIRKSHGRIVLIQQGSVLLVLPALNLVSDLMFVQLTVLCSLNLMIDSNQLLLDSILAGCIQHLHRNWCRIWTPNKPQAD